MLEDDDKILPGSPVKELELKLSPFREQIFTDLKKPKAHLKKETPNQVVHLYLTGKHKLNNVNLT